jgi:hypothetical protein
MGRTTATPLIAVFEVLFWWRSALLTLASSAARWM